MIDLWQSWSLMTHYRSEHMIVCIATEMSLRAKRGNPLKLPRLRAVALQRAGTSSRQSGTPRNDQLWSFEVNHFMLPLITQESKRTSFQKVLETMNKGGLTRGAK